jgi:Tfp pilus assembly pilus retraction ATPase PilT
MADTLHDIIWSDLCVSKDPRQGWYKATPDSMVASSVPEVMYEELAEFYRLLDSTWRARGVDASRYGFPIDWPAENGTRLRVKRIGLANGEHVFICRAFRFKPKSFSELKMVPSLAKRLLSPEIRGGIGLFLGRPGAGKTTTACAYIRERARRLGGVTWTSEGPVEIDIEGRHENGYIHQCEVDSPEQMAESIRDLARATPNVLFVGEVLDDQTAEVVSQAAKMGFLVLCTYHGADLVNGIERFARAAGRGEVSAQFVEAFRFAVHLDLRLVANTTGGSPKPVQDSLIGSLPTGNPPRTLSVRSLFLLNEVDPNRGHMKKGDFAMLGSEIDRQKGELLKELSEINLTKR